MVPGGVRSNEELHAAIQADPVVAHHYAGIDIDSLKPVRLDRDVFAYVSFRMRERVYWTSRKVKLTAGETVFKGKGVGVRGRCGNQLSDEPQLPVLSNAKLEPAGEEFSNPVTWEAAEGEPPSEPLSESLVPMAPELLHPVSSEIPTGGLPLFAEPFLATGQDGSWTAGAGAFRSIGGTSGSPPYQASIPMPPTVGPIIPPLPSDPVSYSPISSTPPTLGILVTPPGAGPPSSLPPIAIVAVPQPGPHVDTPVAILLSPGSSSGPSLGTPSQPPVTSPFPTVDQPVKPDPPPLAPLRTEEGVPELSTWEMVLVGFSIALIFRVVRRVRLTAAES